MACVSKEDVAQILYGEEAVSFCAMCQQLTWMADMCCCLFRMQAVLCAAALQDDSSMNSMGTSADGMGMSKKDITHDPDVTMHACHPTHDNQIWQVCDLLIILFLSHN